MRIGRIRRTGRKYATGYMYWSARMYRSSCVESIYEEQVNHSCIPLRLAKRCNVRRGSVFDPYVTRDLPCNDPMKPVFFLEQQPRHSQALEGQPYFLPISQKHGRIESMLPSPLVPSCAASQGVTGDEIDSTNCHLVCWRLDGMRKALRSMHTAPRRHFRDGH